MFQPCRNLRCFVLVNPLVTDSVSSHQRQRWLFKIFYKVVTKFGCFYTCFIPFSPSRSHTALCFHSIYLHVYFLLIDLSLSFYALFCLIHILSLFYLLGIYFSSVLLSLKQQAALWSLRHRGPLHSITKTSLYILFKPCLWNPVQTPCPLKSAHSSSFSVSLGCKINTGFTWFSRDENNTSKIKCRFLKLFMLWTFIATKV